MFGMENDHEPVLALAQDLDRQFHAAWPVEPVGRIGRVDGGKAASVCREVGKLSSLQGNEPWKVLSLTRIDNPGPVPEQDGKPVVVQFDITSGRGFPADLEPPGVVEHAGKIGLAVEVGAQPALRCQYLVGKAVGLRLLL